ncbi:MAG: hypothetical protein ACHQ1D_06330 [Nitrososphaerales archaeon]|jgi:hypothetical protein
MSVTQTIELDEYNQPLVPLITIKNRSSSKTILTHNVLDGDITGFAPYEISVESGVRKTGAFTIKCYDDAGFIKNGEIRHRNRVNIKVKKPFQSQYQDLINGLIIDIKKIEYGPAGAEAWELSGQSMKHIWGHTFIKYERNVPFLNMKENQLNLKNNDKKYYVNNLIYDIFTNPNIMINNNGKSLQERGGFTLNGIDRTIPVTIPATKYSGTADSLLNQYAEMVGLFVGVDETNDVFSRLPVYKSTGHVLKAQALGTENPDFTSIVREQIEIGSSTDPSQYAEVVIGQADTSSVVSNNSSTNNFTTLFNKDIAQQIELRSTQLYELTLVLSKINAGTDSDNPENTNLRAFIVNDNNDRIGTDVVAELSFALRDIPATPAPISRKNVVFKRPIVANSKYWLIVQEIGSSDNNTVLWWHDDGFASGNGEKTLCAIRDVPFGRGEGEAYIPVGWKLFRNEQVYSNTFTSQTPILHVSNTLFSGSLEDYEDPAPVETIQSPTNVHDSSTMMQHLAIFNEFSSRIVQPYGFGKVSTPNKLFKPGTAIVYINPSGVQYGVNITDIRYDFIIEENAEVLGTKDCELSGIGYLHPSAGDSFNAELDAASFYCY